jgi:hypothetical protein
MNDLDFIKFLCEQIQEIISDGDIPDMNIIKRELKIRDIPINSVFPYEKD